MLASFISILPTSKCWTSYFPHVGCNSVSAPFYGLSCLFIRAFTSAIKDEVWYDLILAVWLMPDRYQYQFGTANQKTFCTIFSGAMWTNPIPVCNAVKPVVFVSGGTRILTRLFFECARRPPARKGPFVYLLHSWLASGLWLQRQHNSN